MITDDYINKLLGRSRISIKVTLYPDMKQHMDRDILERHVKMTMINQLNEKVTENFGSFITENINNNEFEERNLDLVVIPTELFNSLLKELKK